MCAVKSTTEEIEINKLALQAALVVQCFGHQKCTSLNNISLLFYYFKTAGFAPATQ
jgi:hypothetical protein